MVRLSGATTCTINSLNRERVRYMNWNEIHTEREIEEFMRRFGLFHDSCIVEMKYISGAFVNENLSMNAVDNVRTLSLLFERQYHNPQTIEMEFKGLIRLNLIPCGENQTCEIHEATFLLKNSEFYWGDCGKIVDFVNYKGTWLQAKQIRWRIVEKY